MANGLKLILVWDKLMQWAQALLSLLSQQRLYTHLLSKCLFLGVFYFSCAYTSTFELEAQTQRIGKTHYAWSDAGESLIDVGLRYDMGYEEMRRANPGLDPNLPLAEHTQILIPAEFSLPKVAREGIVIKLSDYRLYFFPKDESIVMSFPIGIGRKGWKTPLGQTKVIAKQINPSWHPSSQLINYAEEQGVVMPASFPGGRGNPLGEHVLRLGWSGYLIHGSQHREGVGQRISAGCIRMLPEDIDYLYELVELGTKVRILK